MAEAEQNQEDPALEEQEIPDDIRNAFQPFLEKNPASQLVRRSEFEGDMIVVSAPWGEASLVLRIPEQHQELASQLEHIYLHPRLSAVMHKDTNQLEIIWSAYKVNKAILDVIGRSFNFRYEGTEYPCNFARSSERLLAIANSHAPVGPSETGYRNLTSFKRLLNEENEEAKNKLFGEPYSFYINSVDLNDDKLIEMLSNLNFYINYYDVKSPFVLIHPPSAASSGANKRIRFRHNEFPATINARKIDPQLLQFWAACANADSARRFLYAFRIIEHSAFFFVENAPKQAVRKVLNSPHVLDDLEKITQEVIAAVQKSKFDDYAKFEALLQQSVDPAMLWQEIEANIEPFSADIVFEGDYKLSALVAGKNSKNDFMINGIKNFCNLSRKIRNALSHGKEERSAAVITPTSSNYEKLAPWANLMQVAAAEVILYNGV